MDTRDRSLYPSAEAAKAAGVPDEFLAEVDGPAPFEGEKLTITNGPFKGRVYERRHGQLRRVK